MGIETVVIESSLCHVAHAESKYAAIRPTRQEGISEGGSQDSERIASYSLEEVRGGHGRLNDPCTSRSPGTARKAFREHRRAFIHLLFACGMSLHSALLDILEPMKNISPSKIDCGDYARGCYEAPPSIVNIALDALPHFRWIVAGPGLVNRK